MCNNNKTYRVLGMRLDACGMVLMSIPFFLCCFFGPYLLISSVNCTYTHYDGHYNGNYYDSGSGNYYGTSRQCTDFSNAGVNVCLFGVVLLFIILASFTKGNVIRSPNNRTFLAQALPVSTLPTATPTAPPPYTNMMPQMGYVQQQQQQQQLHQQQGAHVVNMNQNQGHM